MVDMIGEIIGAVIATGILAGVKRLGDLTNAVRDLDARVSTLERWLHRPGIQQPPGRGDDFIPVEKRGGGGKG
jgi:hypothetical protein